MTSLRLLGLAGLLLGSVGCSTMSDLSGTGNSEYFLGRVGPNIMGGFRMDITAMRKGEAQMAAPFWILDTPWSLALDIVVLPFTVPYVLLSDPAPRLPPPE